MILINTRLIFYSKQPTLVNSQFAYLWVLKNAKNIGDQPGSDQARSDQ